jgi:hypothetical protein
MCLGRTRPTSSWAFRVFRESPFLDRKPGRRISGARLSFLHHRPSLWHRRPPPILGPHPRRPLIPLTPGARLTTLTTKMTMPLVPTARSSGAARPPLRWWWRLRWLCVVVAPVVARGRRRSASSRRGRARPLLVWVCLPPPRRCETALVRVCDRRRSASSRRGRVRPPLVWKPLQVAWMEPRSRRVASALGLMLADGSAAVELRPTCRCCRFVRTCPRTWPASASTAFSR